MSEQLMGQARYKLIVDYQKAITDMRRFQTDVEQSNANIGKSFAGLRNTAVGLFAGVKVADLVRDSAKLAARYGEMEEKFNRVFGSMNQSIRTQLKGWTEVRDISEYASREIAASFGAQFKGAGMAGAKLADLSTKYVKLTYDLAAFNDLNTPEAARLMTSGLAGESEALRRLNIFTNEASLKSKALAMGIADGKKQLTQAQRAQTLYAIAMEQTGAAQDNWSETMESSAMRLKRLEERSIDLQVKLGNKLLPVMDDLTSSGLKLLDTGSGVIDFFSTWQGKAVLVGSALGVVAAKTASILRDMKALTSMSAFGSMSKGAGGMGWGQTGAIVGGESALDYLMHRSQNSALVNSLNPPEISNGFKRVLVEAEKDDWVDKAGNYYAYEDAKYHRSIGHYMDIPHGPGSAAAASAAPAVAKRFGPALLEGFLGTSILGGLTGATKPGWLGNKISNTSLAKKISAKIPLDAAGKGGAILGKTAGMAIDIAIAVEATRLIDGLYDAIVGRAEGERRTDNKGNRVDPGWTPVRFRDWINFDPIRTAGTGADAISYSWDNFRDWTGSFGRNRRAKNYLKNQDGSIREEVEKDAKEWAKFKPTNLSAKQIVAIMKKAGAPEEALKPFLDKAKAEALSPEMEEIIRDTKRKASLVGVENEFTRRRIELEQQRNDAIRPYVKKDGEEDTPTDKKMRKLIWDSFKPDFDQLDIDRRKSATSSAQQEKRAQMEIREIILRRLSTSESIYKAEIKAADARYSEEKEQLEELARKGEDVQERLKAAEQRRISAIESAKQQQRERDYRDREERFSRLEENERTLRRVGREKEDANFSVWGSQAVISNKPWAARRIGIDHQYQSSLADIEDERKDLKRDKNRLEREIKLAEETPGYNPENLKVMRDTLAGYDQRMNSLPYKVQSAQWTRMAGMAEMGRDRQDMLRGMFENFATSGVYRDEFNRLRGLGMMAPEAASKADRAVRGRQAYFDYQSSVRNLDGLELTPEQKKLAQKNLWEDFQFKMKGISDEERTEMQSKVGWVDIESVWKNIKVAGFKSAFNDPAQVAKEQLEEGKKQTALLTRTVDLLAQGASNGTTDAALGSVLR